jgi:hypothetical protein
VQPKNKEACTAAPLHPPEHGAKSSDPCGDGNVFYAVFASIVIMADHNPGGDDGGLLGRRFCWSGLEVIVVSRLGMNRTKVLVYRTNVLLACLIKVRC